MLAALAIWLACGRHLVLFSVAYLTVPGMSWFRVPARALFLANVAAAVLAGLGVETLRKHMTAPRNWHALARRFAAIASLVVAALLAILLVRGTDGSSRSAAATAQVIRAGCFWLTIGGMGGLICVGTLSGQPAGRRWAGGLMGLVALCELGSYGFTLMRVAPAERFLGDDPVGAASFGLTASRIDPAASASRHATRFTAICGQPGWTSKRSTSTTSFSSTTLPGCFDSCIPSQGFSVAGWKAPCSMSSINTGERSDRRFSIA